MNRLQSCLDALSEHQLRNMVLRVATQDPYFCDVFAMELGEALNTSASEDVIHPSENAKPSYHHYTRPRTLSNTLVHFPPQYADDSGSDQEDPTYHPGQLESEEYEFLTVSQEGRAYRQIRTVSMWSCCDGDDMSTGCKTAFAHTFMSEPSVSHFHHMHTKSKKRYPPRVQRT